MVRGKSLKIPIVYNSGGYESVETLKLLDGYVDIYLPDFKYTDSEIAKKYSSAPDYPQTAKKAIAQMVRQAGGCEFDERGIMKSGVIVRHLVLPSYVENSKRAVEYLFNTYGHGIYMSIMNQYTPMEYVKNYPEINRSVTESEYDEVIDFAVEIGVENAFIQEGGAVSESFIPLFDGTGIL
jgi:putative pyruvate formate lyase activating enzyme